jgi:hypothetical protein
VCDEADVCAAQLLNKCEEHKSSKLNYDTTFQIAAYSTLIDAAG